MQVRIAMAKCGLARASGSERRLKFSNLSLFEFRFGIGRHGPHSFDLLLRAHWSGGELDVLEDPVVLVRS